MGDRLDGSDPLRAVGDSERFYRALVENASEGLLTIDTDSRIVYANPAIEEILGYAPEELVGSSKMKIIPERLRPIHADALESYVQTGERHIDWNGIELPALHKRGHEVSTLISFREHNHEDQRFFTGVIRDVTERKRRRTELRRQKERLDNFAGILSHDIKNPLQVAQGYTSLAREERDLPELERVADALERIEVLVEDVLALSRDGADIGAIESISVEQYVRETWAGVANEGSTLVVADKIGSLEVDESRFHALLSNIFRNAIDHVGPDVTVRIGRLPDDDGFYVEDDGPGIPESIHKTVFDYGYSTRESGTGYGLFIVARIADAHGWDVRVVDGSEGGARFEFTGVELVH